MKQKGKRKGVSRRDFLKGLGGGAVGTAVISAGLLKPGRAEGASAGVPIKPKISLKSKEVQGLDKVLAHVLQDIQRATGQEDVLVTCRLNEPNIEYPAPIWYGWVESGGLWKMRKSQHQDDPRSSLIGGTNVSPIYAKCLTHPRTDIVHKIDYSQIERVAEEKTRKAFRWDVKLGLNHRRFVVITADGRRVGTLTVGLPKAPTNDDQLEKRLLYWAQDCNSPFVNYLLKKSGIRLGGPEI